MRTTQVSSVTSSKRVEQENKERPSAALLLKVTSGRHAFKNGSRIEKHKGWDGDVWI